MVLVIDIMFDMSEVPEELLPYAGILQGVLESLMRIMNMVSSLMRSMCIPAVSVHRWNFTPDVTKAKRKRIPATFEIKAKALYDKLPITFNMMVRFW